jgi:predicted DNA-binding protein (UPF0278 family)
MANPFKTVRLWDEDIWLEMWDFRTEHGYTSIEQVIYVAWEAFKQQYKEEIIREEIAKIIKDENDAEILRQKIRQKLLKGFL